MLWPSSRLRCLGSCTSFRRSRGEKSERKSEHMTLLKDTPQLAFCIGFAWKTPGAERNILWGGDSLIFKGSWHGFHSKTASCQIRHLEESSQTRERQTHSTETDMSFLWNKMKCFQGITVYAVSFFLCNTYFLEVINPLQLTVPHQGIF